MRREVRLGEVGAARRGKSSQLAIVSVSPGAGGFGDSDEPCCLIREGLSRRAGSRMDRGDSPTCGMADPVANMGR